MLRGVLVAPLVFILCALAAPQAEAQMTVRIPQVKVKVRYFCREGRYWTSSNGGERHYCFDGKHYSKSTGGVPAFVLDYWAKSEQESRELEERLSKQREEHRRIAAAHAQTRARSTRYLRYTPPSPVEHSTKAVSVPVRLELFQGVEAGTTREAVLKSLGEPHGSMSNLGAEGDEESLTYMLEGGGQANIRLKQGKVTLVRLPKT